MTMVAHLKTAEENRNQEWDEQFHALVAKNMMSAPFEPMLYKNLLLPAFDSDWTMGHIWLHKQPLFLWQMALSMKIFGVNVIALRLPSLLMSTAVTYLIYRIGSVTINKSAGFYGALLFAFSNSASPATRMTGLKPQAAAAAARQCLSPCACCQWRTAPISWAACATPPPGTTCLACAQARAAYRCGR